MSLNGQIKHNYLLEHVRARSRIVPNWNPRDRESLSQQQLNMIIIIIPFVKEIPVMKISVSSDVH